MFKRKIFKNIKDVKTLKKYLESAINSISKLKNLIWSLYLENLRQSRGASWFDSFSKILGGNLSNEVINSISPTDVISKIGVVWNLDKENKLLKNLFEEYSNSNHWEILASVCCHKDCPPEILNKIAKEKATTKGYEYILRIISRNKNTSKETLEYISNNQELEDRYRTVAKKALEKGVGGANESR